MFLILFFTSVATLLLIPAAVIFVYDKYRFTPEGKRRSFLLYILGVILSYFLAAEAMAVFLQVGCPEGSGNGCVFGASLIAQPVFLVCMGSYLCLWVRIGKRNARTRIMSVTTRTVAGAILSPSALVIVWSLPAVGSMAFFQWLIFNAAICFPLFLTCAAISHFLLSRNQWSRLPQYVGVMFSVATVVLMVARVVMLQWIFGHGGSEYHFGTQVIENGNFTLAGILLTFGESMFGALWLAGTFALFWTIAVRTRARSDGA